MVLVIVVGFHAMTWAFLNIRKLGLLLLLLLLLVLVLENPSYASENGNSLRGESEKGSLLNTVKIHQNGGIAAHLFDAQKRTVYTGPNPLHNR